VARLCSRVPAQRFGLYPKKGHVCVGADADFTVVDMNKINTFTRSNMATKSGHTSWEGITTRGMPVHTIVRGSMVVEDCVVVGKPGAGKFMPGTGI